jgi:hypothetical protein
MGVAIGFRDGLLCVMEERNGSIAWLPVREADDGEPPTLDGRPVSLIDSKEGVYVDEQGTVYQLMDKGETKPIKIEHLAGTEKTELETLLEASLNGRAGDGQNAGPKQLFRKKRSSKPKQQKLRIATAAPKPHRAEALPPIEPSAPTPNGTGIED